MLTRISHNGYKTRKRNGDAEAVEWEDAALLRRQARELALVEFELIEAQGDVLIVKLAKLLGVSPEEAAQIAGEYIPPGLNFYDRVLQLLRGEEE